jgi:hypothetical protein
MRAPSLRVVLIAVAAVAVLAGGSLLTRHGPIGGSDEADGGQAGTATTAGGGATTPPTSLASLGTMSERLARLPALAPGELHGILDIGGNGCAQETLDLATLVRTQGRRDVCAVPGAGFGIRLRDVRRNPSRLGVVDLAGRPHGTIPVPEGWDWWGVARQGVVFCRGSDGVGRLRRFRGGSTPLPSCPLTQGRQGLLFRGPGKRSIVDEAGHRLAARAQPLSILTSVRTFGDGLLAIDTDLFRDGRRLASFPAADASLIGASRDGKVGLVGKAQATQLFVYREDGRHAIDPSLAGRSGVVSPDGSRVVLQRDEQLLVVLDAATLRPLAQLRLERRGALLDWRDGPVPGTGRDTAP